MHYPEDAYAANYRPFFIPMLLVTRGHSDVQVVRSGEDAIEYLATACRYTTKAAGVSHRHLMHHDSGFSAVRTIAEMHRPSEAQLWASLKGEVTCYLNTRGSHTHPIIAPSFGYADRHEQFQKYLRCQIRSEDIDFLQWLRIYDTRGDVARVMQKWVALPPGPGRGCMQK